MWRSPTTCIRFTPNEVTPLLLGVQEGLQRFAYSNDNPLALPEPYDTVPGTTQLYEAIRLVSSLTTDVPPPKHGHTALEHCIIYQLLLESYLAGKAGAPDDGGDHHKLFYREPFNLLRAKAGLLPQEDPFTQSFDVAFDDVVSSLFYAETLWVQDNKMLVGIAHNPQLFQAIGVHPSYFTIPREPHLEEIQTAFAATNAIGSWATADYLPNGDPTFIVRRLV